MSDTIKNVTLVGGAGHVGANILEKLVASQKFRVRILKRIGSASSYPEGAEVLEIDFFSLESLTAAFDGQDAVVSAVGDSGVSSQTLMVDAAIQAGVKRFLPSDFGSNLSNAKCRTLAVFAGKVAVEEYLIEKAKSTPLTYTFVYTGGLLDFCLEHNILLDVSRYAPKLFDGGDYAFSTTTMPAVGDAVVAILARAADTKNRAVYTSEMIVSQNQILAVAKQMKPDAPWRPEAVVVDEMVATAKQKLASGERSVAAVLPLLIQSIVKPDFGGLYERNDNRLLGIEEKTDSLLVDLLKPLLN